MCNAVSAGVLSGGAGFFWHNSLNHLMSFIKGDPEGRCLVFNLNVCNRSILLINFYVAFIVDRLASVSHTDVIIMGDFNFEFVDCKYGYTVFKPMLQRFDLSVGSDNKLFCSV